MIFVSNHDKNAWEGTEFEQFGDGLEAAIVLSVVSEGMPLIYNGQEAGNDKRLAFFERDPIEWQEHPHGDLYRRLFALKKANTALWNAPWGARMVHVPNSRQDPAALAAQRGGREPRDGPGLRDGSRHRGVGAEFLPGSHGRATARRPPAALGERMPSPSAFAFTRRPAQHRSLTEGSEGTCCAAPRGLRVQ